MKIGSTEASLRLLRAIITAAWMFPLVILMAVFNSKQAEHIGFVYRDAVRGFGRMGKEFEGDSYE